VNSQGTKICIFLERLVKMPKVLWTSMKVIVIVCATQHAKHAGLKTIFNNLDNLHNPRQRSFTYKQKPPQIRPLAPHVCLLLSQVGVGVGVDSEVVVLEGLTVSLGSGTASVVEDDGAT
jgi:hypothetical protein